MKIIPVYLPQYHTIPENDKWWGKGFTEWTNLKAAKPLFEGHYQPRVPLNNNYYDLSKVETLKWQCRIAREHGIYGFAMYHYWFNGHLLLEKPMEMLLAHPEIDINYCISWANHDWTDGWKAKPGKAKTLITHDFNDEHDWIDHFNYMLPFFKDSRYMKENNKPFLIIYITHIIPKLNKMLDLWQQMAKENGFDGLTFMYQSAASAIATGWDRSRFDYGIEFNPGYAKMVTDDSLKTKVWSYLMRYSRVVKKTLGIKKSLIKPKKEVTKLDYDDIWQKILSLRPKYPNMIPSAMTDWDNTPRHLNNGTVYLGANPSSFKKYFKQLVLNTRKYYHQDKIFVFAWNEWTEGGYLEPDERWGYGYLDAIRDTLQELGELEK